MPPEPRVFVCGDLRFEFEPWSGWLRNLQWRGETVIIALYCAVRAENWSTSLVNSSEITLGEGRISFTAQCLDAPFSWKAELTFGEDWLKYEIEGRADQSFRTARTGLCLLHPTQPRRFSVGHPDGRQDQVCLPDFIQPHQPFTDVKSLEWTSLTGATATLSCDGEVFETEDQRNWTDASLKTYCRRLIDAVPYTLHGGERVHQALSVKLRGGAAASLFTEEFEARFPNVGVFVNSPEELSRCSQVGAGFAALRDSSLFERALSAGIEAHYFPSSLNPDEPKPNTEAEGCIWLPYHTWSAHLASALEGLAERRSKGLKIGAYTPDNFTELNRSRPDFSLLDAVGYGACPQVHARDDRSILENAWALGGTFDSGQKFSQGKPVMPMVRFAQGADDRRGSPLELAYRLLALASLASAGCQQVLFADADLSTASPASDVLWEVLRLVPKEMKVRREGLMTRIDVKGEKGSLAFLVNASPLTSDGVEPYSVRRER